MSDSWTDGDEGNKFADVGKSITFTYEVTNEGTKTLVEFCLFDYNLGDTCLDCPAGTGSIFPGDSFFCSFIYEVLYCCSPCKATVENFLLH